MDDNYPAMTKTQWDNAPFNETTNEPIEVNCYISQTLSKPVIVETSDYIEEYWEDCEPDDEGGYIRSGGVTYDYSNCNFNDDYGNSHKSIPELLDILKDYLQKDIDSTTDPHKIAKLTAIFNDCEDWELDDSEVILDE